MRPVWTLSEFSLQSYSHFCGRSFFQFFQRCGKGEQMRCRLILLITEHPIQQGIRKGGVRHFGHGRGRTEWRILGSWITTALLPTFPTFCPHISQSDPPWKKTPQFGAKKLWNGAKKIFVALAHIIHVFFAKKTDSDWSTFALGRLFIKFRSI